MIYEKKRTDFLTSLPNKTSKSIGREKRDVALIAKVKKIILRLQYDIRKGAGLTVQEMSSYTLTISSHCLPHICLDKVPL